MINQAPKYDYRHRTNIHDLQKSHVHSFHRILLDEPWSGCTSQLPRYLWQLEVVISWERRMKCTKHIEHILIVQNRYRPYKIQVEMCLHSIDRDKQSLHMQWDIGSAATRSNTVTAYRYTMQCKASKYSNKQMTYCFPRMDASSDCSKSCNLEITSMYAWNVCKTKQTPPYKKHQQTNSEHEFQLEKLSKLSIARWLAGIPKQRAHWKISYCW